MTSPDLTTRLARAWLRHPLISFMRHRRTVAFYRQFAALMRAGLGLPVVFTELAKYAPDAGLRHGLVTMGRAVAQGATLAEAMGKHASLFDDVNIELISFAETTGTLDTVLARIIEHLERVHALRWRVVFMSLWPLYLGAAFVFVGPLLGVAQAAKPGAGVLGLYASGLLSNLGWASGLGGLALGAPFIIAALQLEARWDLVKRSLPGLSRAVTDLYAARMMLGLGLGFGAGLEAVRVLRVAARSTGSPSVERQLPAAERRLRSGSSLTDAVDALGLLDRSTLGTLAVAEKTGTLDETLVSMSKELQDASLRATRLLIIVLIAVIAAVLLINIVGSMLGTIFGPIKRLYDAAGSGNLDGL